jgi:hypothetical protein
MEVVDVVGWQAVCGSGKLMEALSLSHDGTDARNRNSTARDVMSVTNYIWVDVEAL